jgi:hypothetical protein
MPLPTVPLFSTTLALGEYWWGWRDNDGDDNDRGRGGFSVRKKVG